MIAKNDLIAGLSDLSDRTLQEAEWYAQRENANSQRENKVQQKADDVELLDNAREYIENDLPLFDDIRQEIALHKEAQKKPPSPTKPEWDGLNVYIPFVAGAKPERFKMLNLLDRGGYDGFGA